MPKSLHAYPQNQLVFGTEPAFFGIDPGKSGGLAMIRGRAVIAVPMPATERDVWEWISNASPSDYAVIEKVGGFIQGNPTPGSAMFSFGAGYGGLRMALVARGVPFEECPPQRWQKAIGIGGRKKGEIKTVWKNRLRAKAQQLFPTLKVTLATADALLIATYCRRKMLGQLG